MDDILALIATQLEHLVQEIHEYITNHLYEHDQETHLFTIKQTTDNTFLDYTIVVPPNMKSIKTIYFNKNNQITHTNTQTVSRLHHANAPSHINIKLASISTLLIKTHDTTTFPHDFIIPTFQILHETLTLGYTYNNFLSILTKTNKSRPHQIWNTIYQIIKTLQKKKLI